MLRHQPSVMHRQVARPRFTGTAPRLPCHVRPRPGVSQPGLPSCRMGCRQSSIQELMMRVFVAGASGAIGKQLVPQLVAAGHEVVGMTSKESHRGLVAELGATPVVADALDTGQVAEAVGRANPEVIVHELTAIGSIDFRHMDRDFAVHQPVADRGHRSSAVGRACGRGATVRGAEFLRGVRAYGWWGQERGGPARPFTCAAGCDRSWPRFVSGGGGARRHVDGGDRAALRRLLRSGYGPDRGRRTGRDDPKAQVAVGGRRRRGVVVHPHRGRR